MVASKDVNLTILVLETARLRRSLMAVVAVRL